MNTIMNIDFAAFSNFKLKLNFPRHSAAKIQESQYIYLIILFYFGYSNSHIIAIYPATHRKQKILQGQRWLG